MISYNLHFEFEVARFFVVDIDAVVVVAHLRCWRCCCLLHNLELPREPVHLLAEKDLLEQMQLQDADAGHGVQWPAAVCFPGRHSAGIQKRRSGSRRISGRAVVEVLRFFLLLVLHVVVIVAVIFVLRR